MRNVYHSGEREVQARAGVRDMAERIGRGIRSSIPGVAQAFLRHLPFAVAGSRDSRGRVWASILTGEPGFLEAIDDRTIRIAATPPAGDPLWESLDRGGHLGMLAIDFASRQRMRVNGTAEVLADGTIRLTTQEVFSNCQKYIQARNVEDGAVSAQGPGPARRANALTAGQQRWIERADTFFVASAHEEAGADASHRGGLPGFVKIRDSRRVAWPDYEGNMMFQTLGNIAANPNAGLLFVNFETGTTLQITGKARIEWDPEAAKEFAGAERVVEFEAEQVIEIPNAVPLRWNFIGYSSFNPTDGGART